MKETPLVLVLLMILCFSLLSADSEVEDCVSLINEKLDFQESGRCGYHGHWYNISWVIGKAINEFYGDTVRPKYDNVVFKRRIADHLNESGIKGGYLDTLESDYLIDVKDIEINGIYHFDCCTDIVLIGYSINWGGIEVAYSEELDSIYILADVFDYTIKGSYNKMIKDLENFGESDLVCRAIMLLALMYDARTTTVISTEKDMIPVLIYQYDILEEDFFFNPGKPYRFAPYTQADSVTKRFYDSLVVDNDKINEKYNEIADTIAEKRFSINPPELRPGFQIDTVVVTIYNDVCPHFALWNLIFTEEGFLDTVMPRNYLYLWGIECRFLRKWIDPYTKKWIEGE